MKIKLVKEVNNCKIGSTIDCDDEVAKDLITKGEAKEYTDAELLAEKKVAIKSYNKGTASNINITVKDKKMDNKEFKLAKMFQNLAGKAITGNSETSSDADGGYLVHTGLAELAPTLTWGSQVYAKCRKIPVAQGANAMKVPVSINSFVKATAMAATNPAEGSAGTKSKAQFIARTLTLTKTSVLLNVTTELLDDTPALDAWLQKEMQGKMAMTLDYEVLLGSSAGYTGANDDTGYTTSVTISATPTLAELQKVVSSVWQGYAPEWYMSATLWNLMVGTFGTAANLNNQLIDIAGYKLLGKPVSVIPTMNTGDLVFGDFANGYTVIGGPDQFSVSREVAFLDDEVSFKLTHRGAGAVTVKALTTGDSLAIGAFACKA